MWNTDILLRYLKSLSPNSQLGNKDLTIKTACLLTLLAGQRVHSVHKISVKSMDINDSIMLCHIPDLLKSTRPKMLERTLSYKAFPGDVDLCPLSCTKEYLLRRSLLVSSEVSELFITYGKPHHPASKETVSRWVKSAMTSSGINTQIFTAGSCRSASGSKANKIGVPLDTILKFGSWTQSSTFYTFYCRDIVDDIVAPGEFGEAILTDTLGH